MITSEYERLVERIVVLKEIAKEYPAKTIENIYQLKTRLKEVSK